MQDLLRDAANIKNAQLKARPGRQAWEGAPDFFKQTAFLADDAVAAARKAPMLRRMQLATELKERGNAAFSQDVLEALQLYVRAISVFMWFDRGQDRASEDIPLVSTLDSRVAAGLPEDEVDTASQLVAACFSNAALCLLRQQRVSDAIYACSKALELDPFHVKALYRRAEAHHQMGTTADLELCVHDLVEAQQLEPGNAQVRAALAKYQGELRELNKRERQAYAAMFQGSQLFESGREEAAKGTAAASTSGCDELGRQEPLSAKSREADRALQAMQRNVARVRSQQADTQRYGRHAAAASAAMQPQRSNFLTVLSHVPWWGWAVILLHLAYRLTKMWGVSPLALVMRGLGQQRDEALWDEGEL